jgi:alpha-L-rhamnosidase
MKAIKLKCDCLNSPLGLSLHKSRLSWICDSGIQQTAYHITAKVNNNTVWDSGEVNSNAMQVLCQYEAKARERVIWTVRLCDETGTWGEESTSFYEYGLTKGLWKAQWINPELVLDDKVRLPASVLRKSFLLNKNQKAQKARLYITCHGMYEATLNGQRVGDFVLAPGIDNYNKRLQVQCYDVTQLLVEGKNKLCVTLGDGLYRGNNGIDGSHNLSGKDIGLLCQLEVDNIPCVCSDASWQASQNGPVRENDTELGETQDARLEGIEGIDNIKDWHDVKIENFGYDNLVCTESVPIKEQETFVGKLFTTPNGEKVIDFGQNIAGYTTVKLSAMAGQKITLWHGETLDKDGNFTQANFEPGSRNKNGGIPQKLTFICKDGLNTFHPKFCIFGFRYAKVETDIPNITQAVFTAIAVYSDMAQTGFFTCGNEDVNRLYQNSLWSMRSNFCDIPTDCPTRERAGWTGDAGVFAPTAVYLADCYPVLRKWLACCRVEQKQNGIVSNIAPVNNISGIITKIIRGSAGWGDACILVPWALYEAYGDETILRENYNMMVKWVRFCKKRANSTRWKNRKNSYKKYLVDKGFHFGEWLEPDISSMDAMRNNLKNGAPEVATAYFSHSAQLLSRIAEILGKDADQKEFALMAEKAKAAYLFTCTEGGTIHSTRQCAYVRPISFNLLDDKEKQAAADALAKLVADKDYHLNTGFLSTPYLCEVLADYGHAETAYKLLLQDTCPSWLYAVKKGATTIWETWDGIREDGTVHDSFNHYSYGAISGWLFSGVCGIKLKDGKFFIKPTPNAVLSHAKAVWDSPLGTVKSAWEYKGKNLCLKISVPANTVADIALPDGTLHTVSAGNYEYEIEY